MIQRSACLSYATIGSPSLLDSQPPPKPDQSVFNGTGPKTTAPVVLLKTANSEFTACRYWVAPTAPIVSGGAELTVNVPAGPVNP